MRDSGRAPMQLFRSSQGVASGFGSRALASSVLLTLSVTAGITRAVSAGPLSNTPINAQSRADHDAARVLRSVRWTQRDGRFHVIADTGGPARFRDFVLADPWRIVIDIEGVRNAVGNKVIAVGATTVDRVRVGQQTPDTVRLVIDTPSRVPYRVMSGGDSIIVVIGPPQFAGAQPSAEARSRNIADPRINAQVTSPDSQKQDSNQQYAEQMRRRVEELEARVKTLEADRSESNRPGVVAAAPESKPPATSTTPVRKGEPAHAHDNIPTGIPRLQIHGFANVDFRASNKPGSANSFALGQLDLFMTSRLSENFSVLAELILEGDRNNPAKNAFSFEIHRLLLQYFPNDYLNLGIGRYHTTIGYYNTAYHHGTWFQTAATRPFIYAFESQGGILPLHNVGMTASGRIPSGALGLRYIAEVGNGRASILPRADLPQTAFDENNGKAFNVGLITRPHRVNGLQAGFSVYHDRLTPTGLPKVGETIMAAHLIYHNPDYEFLNEALLIRHAPVGTDRLYDTHAFYTEISRRFENARPFLRYDYLNAPDDDPIFRAVGRRNGPSVGLRYDVTTFAAFKAQYDRTNGRPLKPFDQLTLQLAFAF